MDPVIERFEAYLAENIIKFKSGEPICSEDMLVYVMILQEYVKYGNKYLDYSEAFRKYNETLFRIFGRSDSNGQ